MKRRTKFVMLMISAAVLAGAWLLAGYMYAGPEAEAVEAASETDAPLLLAAGRREELTALSWSWEGRTVNLRRDEASGLWGNGDDPSCPIDPAAAEALAREAASTTASLAVHGATDLAQYGLDPAPLTVVAATEERIVTYEVGNMSIAGEYYTRVDGGDTVYLENGSLAAFRTGLEALLALETFPEDIGTVTGLAVRSDAGGYAVAYRSEAGEEPGWYRTDGDAPVRLEAEGARRLCETLLETDLTRCVDWRPENAAAYGLDEPQLTATLSYTNSGGRAASFSLVFGGYAEDGIYVSFAGSNMVYLAPAAGPDELMYPSWDKLTPATVLTLDTTAIASISLELGGRSYEILRLEEETERSAGEDTVTVTDVIYSCNGWVLDTKRMESWLASLAGLTAESAAAAGEGRQTLLAATLTWKDGESVPAEVELRSYDSAHCLCIVGGDRLLLVPRTEAEALVAAGESLLEK